MLVRLNLENFLLVDSNWEFSREFAAHLKAQHPDAPSELLIAGDNTKQMLKMMFQEQVKDYCYCDFANEISVSELASYLHEHHKVKGVLIYALDYHLADETQRFIFNSLHRQRITVEQSDRGYVYHPLRDPFNNNHLTCHSTVSATTQDSVLDFSQHHTDKAE
ncbi:hypothetical protein CWC22_003290 [Pseudoalteromonas rubra]|uniref:Uncharacterized protein n=1 Tax=Pseudoalteromonas rubra TaxID=43658 RepID=A0A5S3V4X9_9GAMM|nr:hypothetical protein [Pseudoalteromonas sp. McH1-42]QPB82083.1 hypothetical protein CWC22_003290 [Pseudoalteromonas rubra]